MLIGIILVHRHRRGFLVGRRRQRLVQLYWSSERTCIRSTSRTRRIKRLIKVVVDHDQTLKQIRRSTLRALILFSGYLFFKLVSHHLTSRTWSISNHMKIILFFVRAERRGARRKQYNPGMFPLRKVILNQFAVFYPLLYLTCIRLLSAHEVKHIQKIKSLINSGMKDVISIMRQRNGVTSLKREFERLLSVVPFAMLGHMFITIPGGIINLTSSSKSQVVSEWLQYTLFHGIVLVLIYQLVQTVTRCQEKVRDMISELILCIQEKSIKDPQTRGYQSLIDGLIMDQQFVFTGWYLFPIHRSIILSFVSSIITFSVLLIQLASNSE